MLTPRGTPGTKSSIFIRTRFDQHSAAFTLGLRPVDSYNSELGLRPASSIGSLLFGYGTASRNFLLLPRADNR